MEYKGVKVKSSVYELLSKDDIKECIDYVSGRYEEEFEGISISYKKEPGYAIYYPRKRNISLSKNLSVKSKIFARAILVHELTHVIQHARGGWESLVAPEVVSARKSAGFDIEYFSAPEEIEAFSAQYNYLKSAGMESLMSGYITNYSRMGISLRTVAKFFS